MTARERLESYLDALRRRLRRQIMARAAAIATVGVLLITCTTVWLLAREQFAPSIVLSGRLALTVLLILAAALLLWLPLRRLARENGAGTFEQRLPAQRGRIETYLDSKRREAAGAPSPLMDLLAEDAAGIAERTAIDDVVPSRGIRAGFAIGAAALVSLALLLSVGPAHWGFGSRHLLLGMELPRDAVPVRSVAVTPGDTTVRRNSDLLIRASTEGFDAQQAEVFVRFADQQKWERAPMQPASSSQGRDFQFQLYAVRGPLSYYVEAEGTKSGAHSVTVVDLPRIERVRLTYSYPEWTGLAPRADEESRDIRAVAGTDVKVEVFADAPLDAPALIVDGEADELRHDGRASSGNIRVSKPGHYQIGARVANEFVALSDEYTIEIVPDEKPVIAIEKPGRDWRATSIEEVPVRIQAEDDFRLRDVALRYSVNGGKWQTTPVGGGAKRTDSESLLRLEEIGAEHVADVEKRLMPGDLVSYYAVAKDHKRSVETDLFMVQVQPFERRFTQAQAGAGGAGGMGEEQGAISERQREILLATWNLQRSDERNARSSRQLKDSARMLSELQATLAQQARTLAERTRARVAVDQDEKVKTFVESLERAAGVMDPAAKHLKNFQLRQAVPAEQQALQQLLRAESAFREVQVSMQQNEQGGSGSQASRNFTEMFELEMDLEKNQYESESQLSMQSAREELDEAIRKLKELAQRQERLAQERNRSAMRADEQRWKQEQLRREAEDLRRRLAEMSGQQSGSKSDDPTQGGEPGEKRGDPQGGQDSGQQGQDRRDRQDRGQLARALESVNRALDQMQSANAGSDTNPERSAQSARQAGQDLRRALRQIDQPQSSGIDEALEQFSERAQRMANDQRRVEKDLYDALTRSPQSPYGMNGRAAIDQRRAQELIQSKQQMSDELSQLQRDMRNAVHDHRAHKPQSTRRLSEIVRELEGSDIMYRINRSAAEIYYGRAREAAPREGLITEALDSLERDLREAAVQAARDKGGAPEEPTADTLLAEVAELRRALQGSQPGEQESSPANAGANRRADQDSSEAGRDSSRAGRNSSRQARANTNPHPRAGGEGGRSGLEAWTHATPSGSLEHLQNGSGSLARQTAEIGQRIRDVANRMPRGELSKAELQALRHAANQLRRLSGDPMAEQTEAMLKLIDQIELTALAALSTQDTSARATMPSPDSPRYREAVAEYYRRLGNR